MLRFDREVIIVTDLESVVVFFDFLFVFWLVGADVSDLLPAGPPGKLLNASQGGGNLVSFAARHGENKDLRFGVLSRSIHGDKRQAVAGR